MKKLLFASLVFLSMSSMANQCNVHTWHDVVSKQGEWDVTLKVINQSGKFVDSHCSAFSKRGSSERNRLVYGFSFAQDADFDIAYTLTAVNKSPNSFQSKACVFVITAKGPAQPDVSVLSYRGA